MMRNLLLFGVSMLLLACGDLRSPSDARFGSPEATVNTLLTAYGVLELSPEEVQSRMARRGAFRLRDRAAFEASFIDLDQPGGEGAAGFVVGALAMAHRDARVVRTQSGAEVWLSDDLRLIMHQQNGAFRFVLRESVPSHIRQRLFQVEERARQQEEHGLPISAHGA